jgi:hypothetical protein
MGNRRPRNRLGPCMSPPAVAEGGVSKPDRPPTAYEQRVYEVGGHHCSSCVVQLLRMWLSPRTVPSPCMQHRHHTSAFLHASADVQGHSGGQGVDVRAHGQGTLLLSTSSGPGMLLGVCAACRVRFHLVPVADRSVFCDCMCIMPSAGIQLPMHVLVGGTCSLQDWRQQTEKSACRFSVVSGCTAVAACTRAAG